MKKMLGIALAMLLISTCAIADSGTQTFKVASAVAPLVMPILGNALDGTHTDYAHPAEPYNSGILTEQQFKQTVLPALQSCAAHAASDHCDPTKTAANPPDLTVEDKTTTIIHLLRWKDTDHTAIAFEKWYLYDPNKSTSSFELQTKSQIFQRTTIPGTKHLQFLYIHINSDLTNPKEGIKDGAVLTLQNPVNYTITITKQQTQLVQDLKSVVTLLGFGSGAGTASADIAKESAATIYGYWSVATFDSEYPTSQVVVTASLNTTPPKAAATDVKSTTAAAQLSSKAYSSEKPAYFGLGFAFPVTSYKDVTYNSTSTTITPTSASKTSLTITGDVYFPPAQPGLVSFHYIPHLLFGLPIKGKVLQHTMLGAGVGLHFFSPYAGVIFDTAYGATTGTTPKPGHLVIKGTFGIEISVSTAVALLKGK